MSPTSSWAARVASIGKEYSPAQRSRSVQVHRSPCVHSPKWLSSIKFLRWGSLVKGLQLQLISWTLKKNNFPLEKQNLDIIICKPKGTTENCLKEERK